MRKKSQMSVTRAQSPKFTKTKTKPLERTYVNETAPIIDKLGAALLKKVQKAKTIEVPVKQPSSTRAMALAQQKRREEIESDKKKKELAEREEAKRKARNLEVSIVDVIV